MTDLKPTDTHDIVLQGILRRKHEEWLKKQEELKLKKAEEDLKELDVVHKDFYIDMESEAWLKTATQFLFDEFPDLDIEKKRQVVKRLTDEVTINGAPKQPMKVVVRDTVNIVLGEE
jgi:hypothetical protein